MKTNININNISYVYNENGSNPTRAIDDLSLNVKAGEFVALLGHNGSGKSTVARLINGLLLPTCGEVLVGEIKTTDKKRIFELRSKVGMVFQNPDNQMIATMVEDDIAFGPENLGLDRKEIGERIDFAIKAVGMEEYRHGTPFKLSGGQKQRIAIAGVLAVRPDIIILDESTAMLDPKGRREVFEVIQKLNKEEGMTVILITHYMDEAALFDRVVVMDKGKVVLDGTPLEVFKKDEVLEDIGLKLPRPTKLNKYFKENGLDLGEVLTTQDLIEKLGRE